MSAQPVCHLPVPAPAPHAVPRDENRHSSAPLALFAGIAASETRAQDQPASSAKEKVAVLLASGASVTAAAEQAGLHRSTIHQWLKKDPSFAASIEAARADYVETLRDHLRDQAALALRTLTDLMSDPKTPHSVRLRAALAVLQRPRFPKPGWNLPEQVEAEHERQMLENLAVVEADYDLLRMAQSVRKTAAPAAGARQKSTQFDTIRALVPRNAPCPCGSGEKYKRCCGKSAPPVLGD